MTLEAALFAYLSGLTPIQTLLKDATTGQTRIYPDVLPEKVTYPAVSYFRVSTAEIVTLDGPTGYADARMQFSIWSANVPKIDGTTRGGKADVLAVRGALRTALNGYQGVMSGVTIRGISLEPDSEHDLYEEKTRSYHRAIDFKIAYIEQSDE